MLKLLFSDRTSPNSQPNVQHRDPADRPSTQSQDQPNVQHQNPAPRTDAHLETQVSGNSNNQIDLSKPLKFGDLVVDLNCLASQWYTFGLQLELGADTLDCIGGEKDSNAESCLRKVVQEWLGGSYKECTKEILLEALRSKTIENNRLAKNIQNDRGKFLIKISNLETN